MPRLSIDIDVVFTDHTLDRQAVLRAIAVDLQGVKSEILRMGYRAQLPSSKSGDEVKLLIEGNGVQVKVEVNFVFRGTVLSVGQRALIRQHSAHLDGAARRKAAVGIH